MRIGVYSPNWIGDAVMALPFLQTLRELEPDAEIIIIGKTWVSAIYSYSGAMDKIIPFDDAELKSWTGSWKAGKRIRSLNLDKIYLLTHSLRSAFISWVSRTPLIIGYSDQGRSIFLNGAIPKPTQKQHRSKTYQDLLNINKSELPLPQLKVAEKKDQGDLMNLIEDGPEKWCAVFPGSVAQSRTIPASKWIDILKYPIEEGFGIMLFGSRAEIQLAGEITAGLPQGKVIDLVGKTNLNDSIIRISKCNGSLATDSGLGHISAALGIRTVSLFGAGDPEETAPRGQHTAYISAGVDCSPCRQNNCTNKVTPLVCISKFDAAGIWQTFTSL